MHHAPVSAGGSDGTGAGKPTTGRDAARRPLSPLLSNIMLDDLYKKLERRGHWFCRYADNSNVYVQSRRAGEPVLVSIIAFLTQRLKLKVNEEKSAVDRLWNRSFLGYTVLSGKSSRLRVSPESVKRLKG